MELKRMFTVYEAKGKENYLNSQKKYELLRTLFYFAISISLFAGGWIQTGSRTNLLSVVAILGCLPASKSAVNTIMFFRYHSAEEEDVINIRAHKGNLSELYDCVFTSYKSNFVVAHLVVKDHTICGYSENKSFDESAFVSHLHDILQLDGHKDVTIKIFTDIRKYTDRLDQMNSLEEKNPERTAAIIETLKNVML